MYMPALCIIRHNLSSKQKYDQMIKRGKPPKVAITAIMRKLVVLANVLLRDDRKWTEKPTRPTRILLSAFATQKPAGQRIATRYRNLRHIAA
jgi:hypothetical protein